MNWSWTKFVISLLVVFSCPGLKCSEEPLVTFKCGVERENEVPPCRSNNEACNIIHKRFWFSPLVVRLCRCYITECSMDWSNGDSHTMFINPRMQVKLCSSVQELNPCTPWMHALTSEKEETPGRIAHHVEAHCYCPNYHYYEEVSQTVAHRDITNSTIQIYACKTLRQCSTSQFCGHITSNHYDTYYTCRCPRNHLCIMKEQKKFRVQEALFEGDAYKGYCILHKPVRALPVG